ncbi:hypothetical protein IM311_08355 [Enterobacter cloacae complex sp. P40RS]|uniref:Uncharacterized protein n=1 Tax=Enterobacter pasteurii TaxID=3029761 RepID=A0ABR9Q5I6_9ENTR|nr:hypothetical protein [Enterobacter cloacae complex sp. P40C2]MBE4854082.1 hypothetical protein [Enterobacter pasteurii]MBE4864484.1 hypothetical protein [Enterobacter cloacae complex sp. P40C2]MBE4877446.1 hypothetical protein [Enterobacter cloacae complex sp. P40C]
MAGLPPAAGCRALPYLYLQPNETWNPLTRANILVTRAVVTFTGYNKPFYLDDLLAQDMHLIDASGKTMTTIFPGFHLIQAGKALSHVVW